MASAEGSGEQGRWWNRRKGAGLLPQVPLGAGPEPGRGRSLQLSCFWIPCSPSGTALHGTLHPPWGPPLPSCPLGALSAWVGLGSQTPRATALKWGMPSPPVRGKEGVGLSGGPLASPSCCCSGLGPFVGLGCLFLPAPWGMRWGQGLLPGERGQGIGAPSHPRADRAACGPWSCQVPNTRCLGRLRAPLAATGSSSRGPLGQPAGQTRKGHGPACPASCHGAPGPALCRAEEGLGGPVTGGSSQASCCSTLI